VSAPRAHSLLDVSSSQPRRGIEVEWPVNLPRSLPEVADDVGWHVYSRGELPRICLKSSYLRQPVVALRSRRIPGILGTDRLDLDRITNWSQPWQGPGLVQAARAQIDRRRRSDKLEDRLSGLRLACSTFDPSELPEFINQYVRDDLQPLHGGALYLVEANQQLMFLQMAAVRNMIRAVNDPALIDRARFDARLLDGGYGLFSSDRLGGANHLMPAMAAMCPAVIGFVAFRAAGSLVFLAPQPLMNFDSLQYHGLPDLLEPSYFTTPRPGETVVGTAGVEQSAAFFEWWVDAWNSVLRELLDPSTFRGRNGRFDPIFMLGKSLTLERLLACIQAILVHTGGQNVERMVLLFHALDLFSGMGGGVGRWDRLTNPKQIERDFDRIQGRLADNDGASQVIIPRCQRAVEASTRLRDGFRDGSAPSSAGPSADSRVSSVLKSLRDAGHGLGTGQGSEDLLNLMSHRVNISPDLPDLAWFHLVRMLCFAHWRNPEIDA
jgi:hypothetical protein